MEKTKKCLSIGLSILVSFFIAQNISGQETDSMNQNTENTGVLQFYNSEMLTWDYVFWNGLTLNYKGQRSGINGGVNSEVKKALLEYPDSAKAYKSYKNKNIIAKSLYISGLACLLGGLSYYGYTDIDKQNFGLLTGLIIGGSAATITGLFTGASGKQDIFNAVNTFNQHKVSKFR